MLDLFTQSIINFLYLETGTEIIVKGLSYENWNGQVCCWIGFS
jgi:hypothetical protein